MDQSRERYHALKAEHIPDFSKSQGDPLADSLSAGDSNSSPGGNECGAEEDGGKSTVWSVYYQMADLRAEIKRDLTRLFVDGTPTEDHFFMPKRQRPIPTDEQ